MDDVTRKCTLECEHVFCHLCVKQWVPRSASCPLCRTRIPITSIFDNLFDVGLNYIMFDGRQLIVYIEPLYMDNGDVLQMISNVWEDTIN